MKKTLAALVAAVALIAVVPTSASAGSVCTHGIYYSPDGFVYRFVNHGQGVGGHIHLVWVNRVNQPGSAGFYETFVCNFA